MKTTLRFLLAFILCSCSHLSNEITQSEKEIRIEKICCFTAEGERYALVAPNAYIGTRNKKGLEHIAVIYTNQHGLVGYGVGNPQQPKPCKTLIGMNPFDLFEIKEGVIVGIAEKHKDLAYQLRGLDVAILDIIGKVLKKPIAKLWGDLKRDSVDGYDSTLYFEDLVEGKDLNDYPFEAKDKMQRLAKKAEWVVKKQGFNVLKVKVGRPGRMQGDHAGVLSDIEAVLTIRKAVGPKVRIFVDGNNGYKGHPEWVMEFVQKTQEAEVFALEEMLPEEVSVYTKLKEQLKAEKISITIAEGESVWNYSEEWVNSYLKTGLVDIAQPDMKVFGILWLRKWAEEAEKYGAKLVCHNFGTKVGVYGAIHVALSVPNSDLVEADDIEFPDVEPVGFQFKDGKFSLTGEPGFGIRISEKKLKKLWTVQ